MVGRVGDDARAELLLAALRDAGVDIDAVEAIAGEASGCALITVTPDGDNAIVVAPGANARLSAGDIARHGDLLSAAAVVVCQLEIPLEAVDATARELAEDALLVVNAAPPADLSPPLLERTDVLVVNAPELRGVAGGVGLDVDAPERELVTGLLGHGPRAVLATLGCRRRRCSATGTSACRCAPGRSRWWTPPAPETPPLAPWRPRWPPA